MYMKCAEIQLMCRIPTWEWTIFGFQRIPIWRDKYAICSVRIFVQLVVATVDTLYVLEN